MPVMEENKFETAKVALKKKFEFEPIEKKINELGWIKIIILSLPIIKMLLVIWKTRNRYVGLWIGLIRKKMTLM